MMGEDCIIYPDDKRHETYRAKVDDGCIKFASGESGRGEIHISKSAIRWLSTEGLYRIHEAEKRI